MKAEEYTITTLSEDIRQLAHPPKGDKLEMLRFCRDHPDPYLLHDKKPVLDMTQDDFLGIFSLIALSHLRQPGDFVIIEANGQVVYQLDLDISQEATVKGSIGETIIKINQNSAWVVHSDCPEKICVKTGKIHLAGEMIVCVPNKVVVKITGNQKNQFDVITQ